MIISLPSAATIAISPSTIDHRVDGTVLFTNTPTVNQAITFVPDGLPGQFYAFKFTTAGTTSYNVTFGSGFLSSAVLASGIAPAKVFSMLFVSDGQVLNEVSRTAAM